MYEISGGTTKSYKKVWACQEETSGYDRPWQRNPALPAQKLLWPMMQHWLLLLHFSHGASDLDSPLVVGHCENNLFLSMELSLPSKETKVPLSKGEVLRKPAPQNPLEFTTSSENPISGITEQEFPSV